MLEKQHLQFTIDLLSSPLILSLPIFVFARFRGAGRRGFLIHLGPAERTHVKRPGQSAGRTSVTWGSENLLRVVIDHFGDFPLGRRFPVVLQRVHDLRLGGRRPLLGHRPADRRRRRRRRRTRILLQLFLESLELQKLLFDFRIQVLLLQGASDGCKRGWDRH